MRAAHARTPETRWWWEGARLAEDGEDAEGGGHEVHGEEEEAPRPPLDALLVRPHLLNPPPPTPRTAGQTTSSQAEAATRHPPSPQPTPSTRRVPRPWRAHPPPSQSCSWRAHPTPSQSLLESRAPRPCLSPEAGAPPPAPVFRCVRRRSRWRRGRSRLNTECRPESTAKRRDIRHKRE